MDDKHQIAHKIEEQLERVLPSDITRRLYPAFGTIIFLTLFTTVIALYSFNRFSDVVHSTATETIPLVVSAGRLSERSQSLAASAPNIALARDIEQLKTTMNGLDFQLKEITLALDVLAGHNDPELFALIRQDIKLLANILANLEQLSASRIALKTSRQEFILKLQAIHANFADVAFPVSYGVSSLMNLFANRAGRRSTRMIEQLSQQHASVQKNQPQLTADEVARKIRINNTKLVDQAVKVSINGAEIRGTGNDLLNLLNTVLVLDSRNSVLQVESRVDRAFHGFENALSTFEQGAFAERNPLLTRNLYKIRDDINALRSGINNPFRLRTKELELGEAIDGHLALGRQVSAQMSERVAQFVEGIMIRVASITRDTDTQRGINSTIIAAGGIFSLLVIIIIAIITISALRKREADLRAAKNIAEHANLAKSEFLSSMSHELRTPMNAILGFAQMLEYDPKEPLTKNQKKSVDHILKGGNHLLELINQVLELHKIETGKLSLNFNDIPAQDIIDQSLHLIRMRADEESIKIFNQTTEDNLPLLWTDFTRLTQVLLNLLSNAIKYNNKEGTVTLTCQKIPGRMLRICVTDTGKGISLEKQGDLFKPFERLGLETGEIEGTGIGLTITKRIIKSLGGQIDFESEVNKGSTFWVDVPLSTKQSKIENKTNALARTAEKTEQKSGNSLICTILYIEDNLDNLRLVETIIGQIVNTRLLYAFNAERGLDLAISEVPDLILMDINLPGMNGIEAMKQLQIAAETKDIPVIAITSAALPIDVEKGMKAGFKDYITKPFDVPNLIQTIKETCECVKRSV